MQKIQTNLHEIREKFCARIRAWIRARIHMPEDYVFKEKVQGKYQYH